MGSSSLLVKLRTEIRSSWRHKTAKKVLAHRKRALVPLSFLLMSCASFMPDGGSSIDKTRANEAWQRDPRPLVVAFVAIDGVRAEDVFCRNDAGEPTCSSGEGASMLRLPALAEVERHGVALGAPGFGTFEASGPNYVSLPGYMEMLSGSRDIQCTENDCKNITLPTLFDDFRSQGKAAVFASWDRLAAAASSAPLVPAGLISAGQSQPQGHDGELPAGTPAAYRPDKLTAQEALQYFERERPAFLFVSLGDTDEFAHANDRKKYDEALVSADSFIEKLRSALKVRQGRGERTLLLITTDHGRSRSFVEHCRDFPESRSSFLLAEGTDIVAQGRSHSAGDAYLRDIAPTVRALAGVRKEDNGPGDGRVLTAILRKD